MIHVLPVRDISSVQQDSATQAADDSADLDVKFRATSGEAGIIIMELLAIFGFEWLWPMAPWHENITHP